MNVLPTPPQPYVSMIKLNGRPIMPPLVKPEMRPQLEAWKRAAIEIEKNIRIQKNGVASGLSEVDTVTESCSTDLRQYMQCTSTSPTLADSLPSSHTVTPSQSPRKDLPALAPRVRSGSFTVENPKVVFSPADVTGQVKPSHSQSYTGENQNNDAVLPIAVPFSPKSPSLENGVQKLEMQKILEDYHKLQLEKLKQMQKQELEKLNEENVLRKELFSQSDSGSFVSVVDSLTPLILNNKSPSPSKKAKSGGGGVFDTPSPFFTPYGERAVKSFRFGAGPVLSENAKRKLEAMVKGHLTRRLMQTERVKLLKKTILEIINLPQEDACSDNDGFYSLMNNQLHAARAELYTILFETDTVTQMKMVERHTAMFTRKTESSKNSRRLSSATVKTLSRKGVISEQTVKSEQSPRSKRHLGVSASRCSPTSARFRKRVSTSQKVSKRKDSARGSRPCSAAGHAITALQSLKLHDKPWR